MTQFNRIFLGGQLHHAVQNTVSETWPCLWNGGLQHLNRMVSPQILLKQNYITIQFSISKMSLCSQLRQRFATNIFCIQWPAPSSLGQHYPWLYQLKQAEIFVIKRNNNLFTFMRSSFLCKKNYFNCSGIITWHLKQLLLFYRCCWPQMKICCRRFDVIICSSTVSATIWLCCICDMAIW